MAECSECKKRGKTWTGSDPVCAFSSGTFNTENWNCATVNLLRDIAKRIEGLYRRDDEFSASFGVVRLVEIGEDSIPGYICMTWYKERGRCGRIITMCDDDEPHVTTLAEAEQAIKYWLKNK